MYNLFVVLRVLRLPLIGMSLLIAVSGTVLAQEPTAEHLEAARKAMASTGATDRLDKILPEIATQAKAGLIQNRPDIEAEISFIVDEVAISLAGRRGFLEGEVAQIYAKMFTKEELKTITVFFSSDAGNKFLKLTPLLFRNIDKASTVWRTGVSRDLAKEVGEKLKEKGLQ